MISALNIIGKSVLRAVFVYYFLVIIDFAY